MLWGTTPVSSTGATLGDRPQWLSASCCISHTFPQFALPPSRNFQPKLKAESVPWAPHTTSWMQDNQAWKGLLSTFSCTLSHSIPRVAASLTELSCYASPLWCGKYRVQTHPRGWGCACWLLTLVLTWLVKCFLQWMPCLAVAMLSSAAVPHSVGSSSAVPRVLTSLGGGREIQLLPLTCNHQHTFLINHH